MFVKTRKFLFERKAVSAILFGVLAAYFASAYLEHRGDQIAYMTDPVATVTTLKAVKMGDVMDEGKMLSVDVPRKFRQPGSYSDVGDVIGKSALIDMPVGAHVTDSSITKLGRGSGISALVPRGMRAVTVDLGENSIEGGGVSSGDRVDVLGTINIDSVDGVNMATMTLVEDVEVLTTNGTYRGVPLEEREVGSGFFGGSRGMYGNRILLTLAVTPKEAQDVIFAGKSGEISIALRARGEQRGAASLKPTTGLSVAGRHEELRPVKSKFREYRGRTR